MTKKQKQVGLILVSFGLFMTVLIAAALYRNTKPTFDFPDALPAENTIGYFEFPVKLEENLAAALNKQFKINWNKDLASWAGEKAAYVLFNAAAEEKIDETNIIPLLIVQIKSPEDARNFLKSHGTTLPDFSENTDIKPMKTLDLYFVLRSDLLFISPQPLVLETLFKKDSRQSKRLRDDDAFAKIRRNLDGPFFAYIKPRALPSSYYNIIGNYAGEMPFLSLSFPTLGISGQYADGNLKGRSYAIFDNDIPIEPALPYRASLLPLLPADADTIISGQNLANQLKKIKSLTDNNASIPNLDRINELFLKTYLPDIDLQTLLSLTAREFALSISGNKILFATELNGPQAKDHIEQIRQAFNKTAAGFSPVRREVVLPDGTAAEELIADTSGIKSYTENFENIQIQGILFGENGAVYDAQNQNKWFISNDLSSLKKSILLTKSPGLNFRDTEKYRQTLQLILKNPELLGVSILPQGSFAFSKRTFADHMETDFIFRNE